MIGFLDKNNIDKPTMFFGIKYENSVPITLLWAKLALVINNFSPLRDSENNQDKGLLTKQRVSLFAASVACVRSTVPLLRTIRATISK